MHIGVVTHPAGETHEFIFMTIAFYNEFWVPGDIGKKGIFIWYQAAVKKTQMTFILQCISGILG